VEFGINKGGLKKLGGMAMEVLAREEVE